MTRRASVTALALTALLVLTGCNQGSTATSSSEPSAAPSSADPRTCDRATDDLLATVQRYVDAYGAPLGTHGGGERRKVGADETELTDALAEARSALEQNDCDLETFRGAFAKGMDDITTRGPLARAILLRLTASMTGRLATSPETVTVRPGQDLPRALARLADGSTVVLAPGNHRLSRPLVLLSGVTLRGRGSRRTTVTSTAGGSAILVLTEGRTELRDLTLRHGGPRPASLLVGGPASSVVLTRARLSGAKSRTGASAGDQSGSAVTMTSGTGDAEDRGTTIQVTASHVTGNDAAGILLSGSHRASIRQTTFTSNGQCGVCFTGSSSGAVRGAEFADNGVGVAVIDRSTPLVVDTTFATGQVAVQVADRATPTVRNVRIDGTSRAGMIFGDRSAGRVDRVRCSNVPHGIVVAPKALPYLGQGNRCALGRSG